MKKVIAALRLDGYIIESKQKYGFKWIEAHKTGSLGFTFLLVGRFLNKYFSCQLTENLELIISTDYLKPTNYSLLGTKFIGIPLRSIYEGLKISNLNPKRTLDRKVILRSSQKIPQGKSLDQSFRIFFHNLEIPHAYAIFSYLYNLYGGLRVRVGRKYEIWD